LLGDEHLATPELFRRPEDVVPEVVHELVEPFLGRSGRLDARRLAFWERDAVRIEHSEAAREDCVGLGRDLGGHGRGHDREVDLEPVVEEDALLLEAADRRRLAEAQQRLAEVVDPGRVVQVRGRLVDEERDVDVRGGVGGSIHAGLRAEEHRSANVRSPGGPARDLVEERGDMRLHRARGYTRPKRSRSSPWRRPRSLTVSESRASFSSTVLTTHAPARMTSARFGWRPGISRR